MTFVAGQKVRALELNRGVPNLVRATADTTVISSAALVNATGLVQPLEASAVYWWRLMLLYSTGTTPDLKVAFTVPTGADGDWGISGASVRVTDYGDAATLFLDGANTMAVLEGGITTSSTAGSLQLRFAQNTSTASNTIVRTNSLFSLARVP